MTKRKSAIIEAASRYAYEKAITSTQNGELATLRGITRKHYPDVFPESKPYTLEMARARAKAILAEPKKAKAAPKKANAKRGIRPKEVIISSCDADCFNSVVDTVKAFEKWEEKRYRYSYLTEELLAGLRYLVESHKNHRLAKRGKA